MQKSVIEIIAGVIVLITVIDFIIDGVFDKNIVSTIRKMIRKTNNPSEDLRSQKRVTYLSIFFKVVSLGLLVFSVAFVRLSLTELIVYIIAISIFIVNITALVNRAIN
jgi:hypothetical protein